MEKTINMDLDRAKRIAEMDINTANRQDAVLRELLEILKVYESTGNTEIDMAVQEVRNAAESARYVIMENT